MSLQTVLMSAIVDAMREATQIAADAPTQLVSFSVDLLDDDAVEGATPHVEIVRTTKSLVFSSGEGIAPDGRRAMSATAVHRIVR